MKKVLMGTMLVMALVSLAEVRSAEIGFAGYTGSETLTDFPALIKLPDAVEGFSYAEARVDNSGSPTPTARCWRTTSTIGTPKGSH